jgi:hypothetical protein
MDYLSSPISAFASAQATAPIQTTLEKVLFSTKNIDLINRIRSASTKEEKSTLKKQMPAATISGTFTKRNAQGLIQYNGLICLDFDGQDNDMSTDEMKSIVCAWPQTLYAGLSVGGKGIFVIIPTNLDDHTWHGEMCDVLGQTIQKCGLVYDKACKDITRLRFLSYDENPFVNASCHVFDAKRMRQLLQAKKEEQMSRPPRPLYTRNYTVGTTLDTVGRVEQYVEEIERARIDLTADYEDWLALGFALATELGSNGEPYFIRISRCSPKFKSDDDAAKKYENLVRTNAQKYTIKTFFHMCHKNGIKI